MTSKLTRDPSTRPKGRKSKRAIERKLNRRAHFEQRILQRQQQHIDCVVKRRQLQLFMYQKGISAVPGWIEDLTRVVEYQQSWELQPDENSEPDDA